MHLDIHNTMAAADVRIDWPLAVGTNYVIVVPEGVTEISKDFFEGILFRNGRIKDPKQAQVVAIELPNSLIEIPRELFADNETLTTVTIGNGVKRIHVSAFCGCTRLKTVIMRSGGGTDLTIGSSAFENCASLERVEFPDNLTVLGSAAFSGCKRLKTVIMRPGGGIDLTIGSNAFKNCESLERVEFTDNLSVIELAAFSGCVKLPSFTIPNRVSCIEGYAFSGCTGLKTVTISSDAAIQERCFMGCSSLTTVNFTLEKIPSLGRNAFEECTSLVVDPNWAGRFTTVAGGAFQGVQPFPLILKALDGNEWKVTNWGIPILEMFDETFDFAKHVESCATQQHPEELKEGTWKLRNLDEPLGNTSLQLKVALFLFQNGEWTGETDLTNVWTVDWAVGEDEVIPDSKRGRNSNDDGGAAAKYSKNSGLSFTDLAI
jgi:hypothetical protein